MKLSEQDANHGRQGIDVEQVLGCLTLEEKVAMMSGSGFYRIYKEAKKWGAMPYPAGGSNERLGIEGLKFCDGPRGVIVGHSTCFPCSMARGATFDRDLEVRIGEVMAVEARAQGVNLLGNVCINLLRHPAWGRAQETYGEESYHLGEMGAALSRGTQHHNVIATVKHYALNSLENTRFELDVRVDDRPLYEVYLPHFRKVIEAGCLSVMSAYNKVNGNYCGQDKRLLTDILRGEWGFEGFVHSDWVLGVYSPHGAAAGLDIENPEPAWFGKRLLDAINSGDISEEVPDVAVRRILMTLDQLARQQDPLDAYPPDLVASSAHTAIALEAAEKSAVLLKNESLLPLSPRRTAKLGVFGRLADLENTGDRGSSRVSPPYIRTPLEGLRDYLGAERVTLGGDEGDLDAATRAAAACDAAVVVVGYTALEEGEYIPSDINLGQEELPDTLRAILDGAKQGGQGKAIGGDRASLDLPDDQVALIRAVVSANPATIVVIVAGSAVMVESWHEAAPAILQTFYAGMEGGTALARLVFGETSPSGRLPFTVARNANDYPAFDRTAKEIEYDYWHGYQKFERERHTPRYAFGHGLSYSRFAYSDLTARRLEDGGLEARLTVENTGDCAAIDTPQLYIGWPGRTVERPGKSLRGFERVHLAPGERSEVCFRIAPRDLAWFDPIAHSWKIEAGPYRLIAATSAADADGLEVTLNIAQEEDLGV